MMANHHLWFWKNIYKHEQHMLLWYATWTNMILRGNFRQANLLHLPNPASALEVPGQRPNLVWSIDFQQKAVFFPRKSWASHFWPTYLCNQGGFFLITGWINQGNFAVQSAGFQFYKYNSRAGPSVLVMSAVTWWKMRNRNLNTNREKRM